MHYLTRRGQKLAINEFPYAKLAFFKILDIRTHRPVVIEKQINHRKRRQIDDSNVDKHRKCLKGMYILILNYKKFSKNFF